jgi:hypothetical protein
LGVQSRGPGFYRSLQNVEKMLNIGVVRRKLVGTARLFFGSLVIAGHDE